MGGINRDTVRAYSAYGWSEVIRVARSELVKNSPAATLEEAALLGLPVSMDWVEADGSPGGCSGILVAVEEDSRGRYAVTDDGFGASTNARGFTMGVTTTEEARALMPASLVEQVHGAQRRAGTASEGVLP